MSNASWPASLPQYVQENGYSEGEPDNLIESQMEAGPPKTRRRYTMQHPLFTMQVCTDVTGRSTFDTFFSTTLKHGSLPFDWVHPITRATVTFMFRKPTPKWSVKGAMHTVAFAVERIA